MDFSEFNFHPTVMEGLDAMRFQTATPVQELTIPIIMQGRDIVACAQTGTGKTAAYLLPILHKLCETPHPQDSINAIVIAPTRELAQQIDQQLEGFSYFMPVSSVAVYGGNDGGAWDQQKRGLEKGADFVIATPGRLLSHLNINSNIDFSRVQYFILDEADRMLDMGFFDDIMQVVKRLGKNRQTILFSATMPDKIRQLANAILQDPEEVKIAVSKPAEGIKQSAFICHEGQKQGIIQSLFSEHQPDRAIIFVGSKMKVKEVAAGLRKFCKGVAEMHSDLEQAQREETMNGFRSGRIKLLVATDVVSRGIDVEDIELVINYDVPRAAEDYVHRIGRTARASAEGAAITLVSDKDQPTFKRIEDFLEKEIEKSPVPENLGKAPEYNPAKFVGRFGDKKGQGRGRSGSGKPQRSGGQHRHKKPVANKKAE
jgi:superfamily II DNA/RNA helicase